MFGKRTFSSVYLVGEEFDKSWMGNSLAFLCNRRKVFMGQNLYTKGACYAAMEYARMNRVGDYLYAGPDMIEQNMGMEMIIRGHQEFYPMISAGVNWYMARAECRVRPGRYQRGDSLLQEYGGGGTLPYGAAAGPSRPAEPGDEAASGSFLHWEKEMSRPGDRLGAWKSLSCLR